MPYLDGKRVTNEEWIIARGGNPQGVDWKAATGWREEGEGESEPLPRLTPEPTEDMAPAPKRRTRAKRAAAEAAIAAAVGVTVDLSDADVTLDVENLIELDDTYEDDDAEPA
jgi:hypothetical protein